MPPNKNLLNQESDAPDRIQIGAFGEDLACTYLKKRGYEILERNWKPSSWGEVDIVAREKDVIVIVEVRVRGPGSFLKPQESVTPHKLHLLKKMALLYAKMNAELCQELRVDFVGIELQDTKKPKIELFKNITQD